jgi:kynurenine formamidase
MRRWQRGVAAGGPLLLCLLLLACAKTAQPAEQRTLAFSRLVDLSHTITQDMPHLPGEPLTQIARSPHDGAINHLRLGGRSGTTLRLVAAAQQPGPTLERLSPRSLVLPAVVLDMRDTVDGMAGARVQAADIRRWEQAHGRIPAGSMVLLATGWDIRWGNPAEYLNLDAAQQPQVPGLAADALALLHARQVRGLGIDTPAAGLLASAGASAGAAQTTEPWLLLENLTRLEQLPPTGASLSIGALKVQGAAVSPARVLALVP